MNRIIPDSDFAKHHLAIMEASDRAMLDSLLCQSPPVIRESPSFPVSPWPSPDKPSELVLSRAKFLAPEMLVHNVHAFAPRVFSFLPALPDFMPCQSPIASWNDPRAWGFAFHRNARKVVMFADYMDRGYQCSMELARASSAGRLEALASALAKGAENGITLIPNEHRPHEARQVITLRLYNR